MRTRARVCGVVGALGWMVMLVVVAAILAGLDPAGFHAARMAQEWSAAMASGNLLALIPAVGVVGMVVIPWQPALTRGELADMTDPQSANQPEVVPWCLYDTQAIANAAVGPFTFFTLQNVDKTLCNMEGPGQLPDPQYMIVHYVAADILQVPTATVLANEPNEALKNVENLLKAVRATFTFNMSNKRYGPFPLMMCHALGGATFSGYGYGTAANGTSAGVVNNGIPGSGGFPFSGAVVIPPKVGFDVTVALSAASTLSATVNLRISLVGALYRRVL